MGVDLLNIREITVSYGKESEASVKNFSMTIQPGEIIGIVGESGSGKTTVLRSVLGLLPGKGKVEQGDILYQGSSLLPLNQKQWRELRKTEISMIFQDSGAMINPIRTIGDQFVEYIRIREKIPKKEAWKKGAEVLARMHLSDVNNVMKSYSFQLSGGMRQRVGIAMAMIFQPKLLLADEPTSALDVTTQAQIVRQFMEIRAQYHTAIIIVTHNIAMAAYMSDKLIVMRRGIVVDSGKREDVMNNPTSDYTKDLLACIPDIGGKRYV
jgi:peptide/nickel transport system ATP-binding protein